MITTRGEETDGRCRVNCPGGGALAMKLAHGLVAKEHLASSLCDKLGQAMHAAGTGGARDIILVRGSRRRRAAP